MDSLRILFSSKNRTGRANHLTVAVFAIAAVFASCGGGDSFDGVYICRELGLTYTFSGDTFVAVSDDGDFYNEGIFNRVVESEENGIVKGVILFSDRYGDGEKRYELDGAKLMLNGFAYMKQQPEPRQRRARGGGIIPIGTYVHHVDSNQTFDITGRNKMKPPHGGEVTFKIKLNDRMIHSTMHHKITFIDSDGYSSSDYFTIEGNKLCFYAIGCYIRQ